MDTLNAWSKAYEAYAPYVCSENNLHVSEARLRDIMIVCGSRALSVFLFLVMASDPEGKCQTAISRIVSGTDMRTDTVRKSLGLLAKRGHIAITQTAYEDGGTLPNIYSII